MSEQWSWQCSPLLSLLSCIFWVNEYHLITTIIALSLSFSWFLSWRTAIQSRLNELLSWIALLDWISHSVILGKKLFSFESQLKKLLSCVSFAFSLEDDDHELRGRLDWKDRAVCEVCICVSKGRVHSVIYLNLLLWGNNSPSLFLLAVLLCDYTWSASAGNFTRNTTKDTILLSCTASRLTAVALVEKEKSF